MGEKEHTSKKKKTGLLSVRQLRYTLATTIVLITLLGLSTVFVLRVYFMTESACYDDLAVETQDAIYDLENDLRSDRMMLRVIAGLIGNEDDMDSIEISGYLANYEINSMITQIGILCPNNSIITANGQRKNDGSFDFDREAIKGEHINSAMVAATDTKHIRNYVPIRKDGICMGILFSSASSSSMSKAWLPSVYDKKGYCYVVDRKSGEIIINSSEDDIDDIYNISFKQTNPSYTKNGTIGNILNGKKGYSVFKSESAGENIYMCYLPFSIENWEMVVLVPESAVFSEVAPIRTGLYALVVAAVLIMLLYFIWLIREMKVSVAEAELKANVDVLTGLPNRNRYEAYLKDPGSTMEDLICLFVDANGLHDMNNSKGHSAGDQMLRFISDTLKTLFGGDHIYRIGGDEFVVFLSDKSMTEIGERLTEFNEMLDRNDYHAAVGVCEYENDMSMEQLVGKAEKEMYKAKQEYYEQIGKVMR